MSDVKVDTAQVRAVLDAAIDMALPVSGGAVRKRLKQLRKALGENDAQRHAGYCPNCVIRCEGDHPPCKFEGGCLMDDQPVGTTGSYPSQVEGGDAR